METPENEKLRQIPPSVPYSGGRKGRRRELTVKSIIVPDKTFNLGYQLIVVLYPKMSNVSN